MNEEQLKQHIGANIAAYRKRAGWTQAGLAEKLNYSDKAVSKWERGESVPDVFTLMALSSQLGVSVNDLLEDPNALPANPGRVEKTMEKVVEKALRRKANKNIILALSSLLVWFVAILCCALLSSFDVPYSWLPFLFAIPADCIVMLSLRSAWHDFRWNKALISIIVWGSLLSIFAVIRSVWSYSFWKIFLLGIPGQVAIGLWFRLFRPAKDKHPQPHE